MSPVKWWILIGVLVVLLCIVAVVVAVIMATHTHDNGPAVPPHGQGPTSDQPQAPGPGKEASAVSAGTDQPSAPKTNGTAGQDGPTAPTAKDDEQKDDAKPEEPDLNAVSLAQYEAVFAYEQKVWGKSPTEELSVIQKYEEIENFWPGTDGARKAKARREFLQNADTSEPTPEEAIPDDAEPQTPQPQGDADTQETTGDSPPTDKAE
jgi:hypothetical protein